MTAALVKFLRLPNLIIVGLTQYLLLHCLFMPFLIQEGIKPDFDALHFFLFVLDTILITATGNIINDIEDVEIDKINRPDTLFVSKYISVKNTWKIYWTTAIIGFSLAIYLGIYANAIPFILIYPLAVAALYFYSKKFKKQAFIGNLTVALFCAGVAGIILLMERNSFSQLSENSQGIILSAFGAYAAFAYLSTIFREIVKDIEDMGGDKERGCRTLPITTSVIHAKFLAISHLMILVGLILFISLSFFENSQTILGIYGVTLLIAPPLFMIFKLIKAETKKDYHFISQITKGLMLFGLLFLPLYYYLS